MKIIYNKILPVGRRYHAINLFGILFAKGPCDKYVINHEKIHTAQMKELGYVFFYLIYVIEWMIKCVIYRDSFKAYHALTFEKEAYSHQNNLNYLAARRHFAEFRIK